MQVTDKAAAPGAGWPPQAHICPAGRGPAEDASGTAYACVAVSSMAGVQLLTNLETLHMAIHHHQCLELLLQNQAQNNTF